jgi:predicted metal-dependent hydrolase
MNDVVFVQAKRKTIGIVVRRDGGVVVRYPRSRWGGGLQAAKRFLHTKEAWVRRVQESQKKEHAEHEREKAARAARGDVVHVCTATCIRESLAAFAPRYARMCEHFSIAVGDRPTLGVRRMKSRWGHYKATKEYVRGTSRVLAHSVTLSTRLLHVPLHCLDMVIAHELCHIRYRSHGPRFSHRGRKTSARR